MLAKPFSEIFSDEEEANQAFDYLKDTLKFLGVNNAEDPQFCLSIEPGSRIDHSYLLKALKPIGVESVEDSHYKNNVDLLNKYWCYSKWILVLYFKGWRVCNFSKTSEYKLIFPFVGEHKMRTEKVPHYHRIPEKLKDSYSQVKTDYLNKWKKKNGWYDETQTAYEKALSIYKELEENEFSIKQSIYHQTLAEVVFNLEKRNELLLEGLPAWVGDGNELAPQMQALVKQEQSGGELTTSFEDIKQKVAKEGLQINDRLLRRYHLALKTRQFVILSGVSGTGKTWLTKAYAEAINAEYQLVPVAPNWTTNEDLLGYFNPLHENKYYDTEFSRFLREAATEYKQAQQERRPAKPYHLVLDEMNLARVEYYFAKFLSAMEVRMREGSAPIELGPNEEIGKNELLLTPNLYFIGTVNVDETTHGFADKVYDRAQLIELTVDGSQLKKYLVKEAGDSAYVEVLMQVWDAVHSVAPFAFRVMDEIVTYVKQAEKLSVPWNEALDEQLLQKVLPKFKGVDSRVGKALEEFLKIAENEKNNLELSRKKAEEMLKKFNEHGFTSYFQ